MPHDGWLEVIGDRQRTRVPGHGEGLQVVSPLPPGSEPAIRVGCRDAERGHDDEHAHGGHVGQRIEQLAAAEPECSAAEKKVRDVRPEPGCEPREIAGIEPGAP
jgi:hypothetical protein